VSDERRDATQAAVAQALDHAREHAARGRDEAAKAAYIDVLRADPTHLAALTELGNLALAGGYRSAARTAYEQAVRHHPEIARARVNLANVLRDDADPRAAQLHYAEALRLDPELHEAHQGMAWALAEIDPARAEWHLQCGFTGHALVARPYRGRTAPDGLGGPGGAGVPLLLLVSARGGNIPTELWISDRQFAVTAIFADFYAATAPLPLHALVMNAIGDADLCGAALAGAEALLAQSTAPVINAPARVRLTGRRDNARRLGALPDVIAPRIEARSAAQLLAAADLNYPLLLRRSGFHTGRYFTCVADPAGLAAAVAELVPGSADEPLLAIDYLDARGADGFARKYRVMFVDGAMYPLHLAISRDWKVHYFSADMASHPAHREEERRFLESMPAVLGPRAMAALEAIQRALGLDYAGVDFALAADGRVLLFEANGTMVVFPPPADPIWDYRRAAVDAVLAAARGMLLARTRAYQSITWADKS
jgi:hypothetical protein